VTNFHSIAGAACWMALSTVLAFAALLPPTLA
jgi:hypothetical protein